MMITVSMFSTMQSGRDSVRALSVAEIADELCL